LKVENQGVREYNIAGGKSECKECKWPTAQIEKLNVERSEYLKKLACIRQTSLTALEEKNHG
jgi:translation initiation factor 2 beta subunit (eIF-2beta)/eIF-5